MISNEGKAALLIVAAAGSVLVIGKMRSDKTLQKENAKEINSMSSGSISVSA